MSRHRGSLLPVIAEHVSYFQSNIDPQAKYNEIILTALTLGSWGEYYHMHALAVILNVPIFQYCTFRHNYTNVCLIDPSLSPTELAEAFHHFSFPWLQEVNYRGTSYPNGGHPSTQDTSCSPIINHTLKTRVCSYIEHLPCALV